MIMKNLSIVVGASEAIEQLIIILEAHEAEEKNKPFLQREHEWGIGLDVALRRRFNDS